jgi:excisionase family DNA binding protein
MKIVYIAEKEELQELIKESIHDEIETFLKGLNQKTIPERLSLPEAAQYLGVSKSTMYQFTHTRKIPYYKFGRSVYFYTKEIDDWLKENSFRHKSHNEIEKEAIEYISKAAGRKINRR